MNELMILNEENREVKSYAIYYTINDRFYTIYTSKEKDENNYVILHIAKVLKEVNNTPEGIVPTGKYIGLEISDQSEWDAAKTNIGEIVSNKQNGTPVSVNYLPVSEINGISIKSSKTFKLREDIVDSIIVSEDAGSALEIEPTYQPVVEEAAPVVPAAEEDSTTPVEEEPVVDNFAVAPEIPVEPVAPVTPAAPEVEVAPAPAVEDFAAPAIAPNPFEMQPEVEIPQAPIEEEKPINPYEVMQQQRNEEMVSTLANDNMQDIVAAPFIPVSELESKIEEEPVVEQSPEFAETVIEEGDASTELNINEPVVEEEPVAPEAEVNETPAVEETPAAPEVEVTEAPAAPQQEEVISSESFVDSIVADVSDILDKKEEPTAEEKEDYERLYNDALEKTVELEKELAELHNKLNNIKNIIE